MARIGHCIINSDKESFSKRREPLRSHLFLHCERRHPRDIFVRPGITRCRERDKITRFAGSEIRISQPFKPRRQNTHREREREREAGGGGRSLALVEEIRERPVRQRRIIFAFTRPNDGSRMCFYGRRGNRERSRRSAAVKIRARRSISARAHGRKTKREITVSRSSGRRSSHGARVAAS